MSIDASSPASNEIDVSRLIADASVLNLAGDSTCRITTVPIQDGIEVLAWRGHFERPMTVALRDDSDRIHFTYTLAGKSRCWFEGGVGGKEFEVREHTGNINYGRGRLGRFSQHGSYSSVSVMVRPDVLQRHATDMASELRPAFGSDPWFVQGYKGAELAATAHAIGQALSPGASTDAAPSVPRHRLWLQAQGLSMLALFLEGRAGQASTVQLPPADRKRLLLARDRLLADLTQAPTVAELSLHTGMSVIKLKRGFRQLFGNSIYGLFQQERMGEARRRLQAGNDSVMAVACEFGYANASHFAVAFRKQFGVNPALLKQHF